MAERDTTREMGSEFEFPNTCRTLAHAFEVEPERPTPMATTKLVSLFLKRNIFEITLAQRYDIIV